MKFQSILSLIIAVIALIFAFQNNESVTVSFFNYQFAGSLALIIIAALLLGFIIGFLIVVPGAMKNRWTLKQRNQEIEKLKKEVDASPIQFESENHSFDSTHSLLECY